MVVESYKDLVISGSLKVPLLSFFPTLSAYHVAVVSSLLSIRYSPQFAADL